jgi:hypothetical protein
MRSAARPFKASFPSALTLDSASESDDALFGEGAAGFGCVLFDLWGTTDIDYIPVLAQRLGSLVIKASAFSRLSETCHP